MKSLLAFTFALFAGSISKGSLVVAYPGDAPSTNENGIAAVGPASPSTCNCSSVGRFANTAATSANTNPRTNPSGKEGIGD
jgi:hypothetical protein